jgi:hypothetical protein
MRSYVRMQQRRVGENLSEIINFFQVLKFKLKLLQNFENTERAQRTPCSATRNLYNNKDFAVALIKTT